MAHKCKVAKNGKRQCAVHRAPIALVKRAFNDIIVGDYSADQLKAYHQEVVAVMLDKTKMVPMDDA